VENEQPQGMCKEVVKSGVQIDKENDLFVHVYPLKSNHVIKDKENAYLPNSQIFSIA
jgi:hypothetical protein